MPKYQSFIDFLTHKHPQYIQIWFNIIMNIEKNCCLKINRIGYVFWFQNNFCLVFNNKTFQGFQPAQENAVWNYFVKFQKYCNFYKPKNNSQTQVLDFFQLFITQKTKSISGYYTDICLNLDPLGEIHFQGKSITYFNKQIKWTLHERKGNIQRLPNLIKNNRNLKKMEQNLPQTQNLQQISRKFSLSLKKQPQVLKKTLKKSESLRNLTEDVQNDLNMHFNGNENAYRFSLPIKGVTKRQNKLIGDNRILKLKSEASQKSKSLLSRKDSYRKITGNSATKSLFNERLIKFEQKDFKLPIHKLRKSSSVPDINKIAQSFKQRPLTSNFSQVLKQELKKSQSQEKLQKLKKQSQQKNKLNQLKDFKPLGKQTSKEAALLRNKFSQKIGENSKKLKLQPRNNVSSNKEGIILKSIKTEQSRTNSEYQRYSFHEQKLRTEVSDPIIPIKILQNNDVGYSMDQNFHFISVNGSSSENLTKDQLKLLESKDNLRQQSYNNQFLKRTLSRPRLSLEQTGPKDNQKQVKRDYIFIEKSHNLLEKISKNFFSQSSYISQMIEEFQDIWDSNYENLLKARHKKNDFGFNEFYDQRILGKVQIQKQKIKQLNVLNQLTSKGSLSVRKIVASIEIENLNRVQKSSMYEFYEQKEVSKYSFKIFKSKVQQERLMKVFKEIDRVENRFRRIMPNEERKVKYNKQFKNISTIDFRHFYQEIEQFLAKIKKIQNVSRESSQNSMSRMNIAYRMLSDQNKPTQLQNGPEIALRLRQLYTALIQTFELMGRSILSNEQSSQNFKLVLSIESFFQTNQTVEEQVQLISQMFLKVQKEIGIYYPQSKIQEWQKPPFQNIVKVFNNIFTASFQSPKFTQKKQLYLSQLDFIFEPRAYLSVVDMNSALTKVDSAYASMVLEEAETLQLNRITLDITKAKLNLREKTRLCLIDVQNNYEQYLRNLCMEIDKLMRIYIEIKPEMLFQQNYLEVKNKYLMKMQEIEKVFSFVLSRRLIYLEYETKALGDLFKRIIERRQKISIFLANLDSRLNVYRSDMQKQITDIQNVDKDLKQRLKQLSSKLRHLINDLKDERDIVSNEKQVNLLNEEFAKYNKEKSLLIKRMQENEIIYWDDDTYFQRHVAALMFSLDFIKSEKFRLVYQATIADIDWKLFLSFYDYYTELIKLLDETKLAKIFKPNYDLFTQSLQFIELILYKNYSPTDIEKMNGFDVRIGRESHIKLMPILKRITSMDAKVQDSLLGIFRAAKESEFYKLKKQTIINIDIQFQQVTYHSQILSELKIFKVSNWTEVYDQASILCCEQSDTFLNNVQRFNKMTQQLFYLKKTIIHLNAISLDNKTSMFLSHFTPYERILNSLKSPQRISICQNEIYEIYKNIETERQKLSEEFYNQKVRFFPRLSLLDVNSLVDCFSWKQHSNVVKNIQSLYSQIDDVICQKDSQKIIKLKVGNDMIDFQKQLDPQSMNSIQFLKYVYASVQGLMQDSVTQSYKRICHMKIIAWYIYFTEQVECAFLVKNSIAGLKTQIEQLIKEIGEDIRYDMYQHHKKYEINQLKFFIDFLNKLQHNQDPEHSYLWMNSIKVYQKNKKVVIRQNHHQYEFGYEPQKPQAFEPEFKVERGLKYGTEEHVELYKTSSKITGRPFLNLKLNKTTLKNKIYKMLDIIYKFNFFVIVDHDMVFQSQRRYFQAEDSSEMGKKFFQNNFKTVKTKPVTSEELYSNQNACLLINQLYKGLFYFAEEKQQSEGIREIRLPILMKYPKISSIPTNFRAGSRTIDRPSRLFSLELMVLIQLNKYQDFLSKFEVNVGKISSFFKLINEEFAMSFEKLTKILEDFDKFIKSLKHFKGENEEWKEQSVVSEDNSIEGSEVYDEKDNKKSHFGKQFENELQSNNSIQSIESRGSFESNQRSIQNIDKILQNLLQLTPAMTQSQNGISQQTNSFTCLEITKMINKELFRILMHYYPDKQVEISKIIQYLTTESIQSKDQKDTITEAIQSLKKGGKNVIIYGETSQKSTLIKRYFKYGKNEIEVKREDGKCDKTQIYYLQGFRNYLEIKQTGLKFIIEMESIHEITPTQISQNLIFVNPLSENDLQQKFQESLKLIFMISDSKDYLKQSFQNDIWTCFLDLYTIYSQCEGTLSFISKMDLFLNVIEKQLLVSQQQRSKKKTDTKILLKQLITIMTELFIYSLDVPERKKFLLESKKKKYFQLNQLKGGVNIEDLFNFTSINLETEKVEQLIKRERFMFKHIFPIDRQIAMVKKYFNLEKRYVEYLIKTRIQNDGSNQKITSLETSKPLLKNFNFIFMTENHIVNQTLHMYFKEEFNDEFKHFKKYLPNQKFFTKCIRDSPLNSSIKENLSLTSKTLCVIQDLHLAIPEQQTLIKILTDHHTQFCKSKFYVFFADKTFVKQNTDSKNRKKFQFRPSLVYTIGEIQFEAIFKYLIKNNVHENTIQRAKKLHTKGLFDDEVDYLKFVLQTQVKLPSQLYQKYFINNILLYNLTSSPAVEEMELKYGNFTGENKNLSLNELRQPNNFWTKLSNSIESIEEALTVTYKYAVFMKKRSYLELNEVEVQKYLDRFVLMFDEGRRNAGEYFFIDFQSKKPHSQTQTFQDREDKAYLKNSIILVDLLVKNHLKKYLHLSLNQEKVYIIEEQVTLLPYLISFIHEQRLYTISEESNFISKLISIINSQIKISMEKESQSLSQTVNFQNFYILIKPPLALSQIFMEILNLIIRKISFLNFLPEFQSYVDGEKEKAEYVLNNVNHYQKKIKEFYHVVFNNCKFIVSIKECHKEMFTSVIRPQNICKSDAKLAGFQNNQKSDSLVSRSEVKNKRRLSLRQSLINRQLFQKNQTDSIKKLKSFYENNVSSVDKLSKQFWQNIVYLNVSMREEEKIQVSKVLLAKYFEEFEQVETEEGQATSKNKDVRKKPIYIQLEDLLIEVLQKILSCYNISIQEIDQMIRNTVKLLLVKKRNAESQLDFKILTEEVQISRNILEIKLQVQSKIESLSQKAKSKQKILQYLTKKINQYRDPLKQPQNTWIIEQIIALAQKSSSFQSLEYRASLPFRKRKTEVFYSKNSKDIEKYKGEFYSEAIDSLHESFNEKMQNKQFSATGLREDKTTFFYKALIQSQNSPQFQTLIQENFTFIQGQLLPKTISFQLIQILFKRKDLLRKQTEQIQQTFNRKKRMSIDAKTLELEKSENKRDSKNLSKKTSKIKLKDENLRTSQMSKNNSPQTSENNTKTNFFQNEIVKEESQKQSEQELEAVKENKSLTKYLFMSSNDFIEFYPVESIFDLVYHRYFNFIVDLYEKYEFGEETQTKDQQEQRIRLNKFTEQIRQAEYFLAIDLLTLQKKFTQKYVSELEKGKKQLQLLERYTAICMKFSGQNSQKQNSKEISQENSQNKSLIPLNIKSHLYETVFLNTLSNINDNSELNDNIKKILEIDYETSLFSSIKKLSKNRINLSLSEQVQVKTLEEKGKFIISDPYNEFCHLIKNMEAEFFFVQEGTLKELNKIRFKIVFYMFSIGSMKDFCEKKGLIEKVQKLVERKSLDSKSTSQKIVLLVSSKKLLDALNLSQNNYTVLNLEYTYMKFSQQINIKKQKLSRQETQSLFESYTNSYSRLCKLSREIAGYKVEQRDKIMKSLEKAENSIIKKFLTLSKQIEDIYAQKNNKHFEQSKCCIIYQYLNKLIEQDIIPYRYIKRINYKMDWLNMEELVSTYSQTRRKHQSNLKASPGSINGEIKEWLAKQLLALRGETFIDEFRECIAVSNVIIVVYDILHQKILKEIKSIEEAEKIQFKFYFEYQKLRKNDFLIDVDENNQLSFVDDAKQNLSNADKEPSKKSVVSFEKLEKKTSMGLLKTPSMRKKRTDDSQDYGQCSLKKRIYFVQEKQIYKVKEVIHICSILWV